MHHRPQLITKPMKAPNDERRIQQQFYQYPCFASPKIDAIRCLHEDEVGVVTSSFKPQPNPYVRKMISALPVGLDGEIVDSDFRTSLSSIKCTWGEPDFKFCIFDYVKESLKDPAWKRYQDLDEIKESLPDWCLVLPQIVVYNEQELADLVDSWAIDGYQGIPLDGAMLRGLDSCYKCGRATLRERTLLKDKPYEDAEAVVLDIYEQEANLNEATINALGTTSRSAHQENKVGKETLGGIICRGINGPYKGKILRFGTGQNWTKEWRQEMFDNPDKILSKIITYKYLAVGDYDLPRNASVKGIREAWDI